HASKISGGRSSGVSPASADNLLLAPGARDRIGQLKCLHPIDNRCENGPTVLKNVKKVRHLRRVGRTIALKEEWFKHISAHSLIRVRDHLRRAFLSQKGFGFIFQDPTEDV